MAACCLTICAAACSGRAALSVDVPGAPAICDDPAPETYQTGEPLPATVAKLANERDAALLHLGGCRNGWNAMADGYRNRGPK